MTRFAPFGAFLELAEGLEGLIHISQISTERIELPEKALTLGETLEVKILKYEPKTRKISLSRREVLAPSSERPERAERGDRPERPAGDRPPRREGGGGDRPRGGGDRNRGGFGGGGRDRGDKGGGLRAEHAQFLKDQGSLNILGDALKKARQEEK